MQKSSPKSWTGKISEPLGVWWCQQRHPNQIYKFQENEGSGALPPSEMAWLDLEHRNNWTNQSDYNYNNIVLHPLAQFKTINDYTICETCGLSLKWQYREICMTWNKNYVERGHNLLRETPRTEQNLQHKTARRKQNLLTEIVFMEEFPDSPMHSGRDIGIGPFMPALVTSYIFHQKTSYCSSFNTVHPVKTKYLVLTPPLVLNISRLSLLTELPTFQKSNWPCKWKVTRSECFHSNNFSLTMSSC